MPKLDFSHYQGREQAYVKHYLLQKYLPEWAYKVGTKWNSVAYIDGFAGPWGTTDPNHADSSFALAVDTLRECKLGLLHSRGVDLSTYAFLVESKQEAFAKLDSFARSANGSGVSVTAIAGKFVERIPRINHLLRSTGSQTFKVCITRSHGMG